MLWIPYVLVMESETVLEEISVIALKKINDMEEKNVKLLIVMASLTQTHPLFAIIMEIVTFQVNAIVHFLWKESQRIFVIFRRAMELLQMNWGFAHRMEYVKRMMDVTVFLQSAFPPIVASLIVLAI